MSPFLELRNLSKRFGALAAVDDVSIAFDPGKIHALLGENGAGKSTIAKCVIGLHRPTSGEVRLNGANAHIANPNVAHAKGIGMVHQHYSLVPSLTVLENLVLAKASRKLAYHWKTERALCAERIGDFPFSIDLDRRVSHLSAGEKQRIEIVKQLYLDTKILILDEPTSVLTPQEADEILAYLQAFVSRGDRTAILITHKLREVMAFADRYHILRNGRHIADGRVGDTSAAALAEMMVGAGAGAAMRPISPRVRAKGAPILEIRDLRATDARGAATLNGVSLDLFPGEILGVAGVSGNGQRELMEVLCGQRRPKGGTMKVAGETYHATRSQQIAHGFRLLPEEPILNAAVHDMTVAENLMMRDYDRRPIAKRAFIYARRFRRKAAEKVAAFSISAPGLQAPLSVLSGGNIQRVMLAREITDETNALIVCNPCHGLDVKAISLVHRRLQALRDRGGAVLLVSEDLDEILALSDRIKVIFNGEFMKTFTRDQANRASIGGLMAGHA